MFQLKTILLFSYIYLHATHYMILVLKYWRSVWVAVIQLLKIGHVNLWLLRSLSVFFRVHRTNVRVVPGVHRTNVRVVPGVHRTNVQVVPGVQYKGDFILYVFIVYWLFLKRLVLKIHGCCNVIFTQEGIIIKLFVWINQRGAFQ